MGAYIEKKKAKTYADYTTFLENEGIELIKTLCEKYKEVPKLEDDETFYKDFGAKKR